MKKIILFTAAIVFCTLPIFARVGSDAPSKSSLTRITDNTKGMTEQGLFSWNNITSRILKSEANPNLRVSQSFNARVVLEGTGDKTTPFTDAKLVVATKAPERSKLEGQVTETTFQIDYVPDVKGAYVVDQGSGAVVYRRTGDGFTEIYNSYDIEKIGDVNYRVQTSSAKLRNLSKSSDWTNVAYDQKIFVTTEPATFYPASGQQVVVPPSLWVRIPTSAGTSNKGIPLTTFPEGKVVNWKAQVTSGKNPTTQLEVHVAANDGSVYAYEVAIPHESNKPVADEVNQKAVVENASTSAAKNVKISKPRKLSAKEIENLRIVATQAQEFNPANKSLPSGGLNIRKAPKAPEAAGTAN